MASENYRQWAAKFGLPGGFPSDQRNQPPDHAPTPGTKEYADWVIEQLAGCVRHW